MYLNFKDICMSIFKCLIWTIFIFLIFHINVFNYNVGVAFCELMEIPKDLTLTVMSPGVAIEVTIILFIVELMILLFIINFLRRYKIFNFLYNFLSLNCLNL